MKSGRSVVPLSSRFRSLSVEVFQCAPNLSFAAGSEVRDDLLNDRELVAEVADKPTKFDCIEYEKDPGMVALVAEATERFSVGQVAGDLTTVSSENGGA